MNFHYPISLSSITASRFPAHSSSNVRWPLSQFKTQFQHLSLQLSWSSKPWQMQLFFRYMVKIIRQRYWSIILGLLKRPNWKFMTQWLVAGPNFIGCKIFSCGFLNAGCNLLKKSESDKKQNWKKRRLDFFKSSIFLWFWTKLKNKNGWITFRHKFIQMRISF